MAKATIDGAAGLKGILPKTLYRAKDNLGITVSPVHSPSNKGVTRWEWSLLHILMVSFIIEHKEIDEVSIVGASKMRPNLKFEWHLRHIV